MNDTHEKLITELHEMGVKFGNPEFVLSLGRYFKLLKKIEREHAQKR